MRPPVPVTVNLRRKATGIPRPRLPAANASEPALALYEQVKAFVVQRIQDGSWPTGHRLPSEHELVASFGISRMTINRALRELTEQGRIVRVSGIGSFVKESKPQSTLLQIANIASEIRERGHDYRCEVLILERIAASVDLAPGASVFHIVCRHLEDGVPVQLEDRYVNPSVVPAFLDQDFAATPPGEYLIRNVPFDQIEHVVDAVLPTPLQAQRLAMSASDPCLLLTRRTWTRKLLVTMVRCLHPASRYRLGCRFRPDGNSNAS
jgi:GntR family histidine utilization transcriptional repressor